MHLHVVGIPIQDAGEKTLIQGRSTRFHLHLLSSPDRLSRCDIPAHNYQLPWAASPDWSEFYATAPEIQVSALYLCVRSYCGCF
jgi:hypothetical protein